MEARERLLLRPTRKCPNRVGRGLAPAEWGRRVPQLRRQQATALPDMRICAHREGTGSLSCIPDGAWGEVTRKHDDATKSLQALKNSGKRCETRCLSLMGETARPRYMRKNYTKVKYRSSIDAYSALVALPFGS